MSDNKKLLKLLLSHEFYLENRHRVSDKFFPDEAEIVWKIIKEAHERYERDLSTDELQSLYLSRNPAATRLTKEQVCGCIADVAEVPEIGSDIGQEVLKSLWQQETGRQIAEMAVDIASGKLSTLQPIQTLIEQVGDDFVPEDFVEPVETDVERLIEQLEHKAQWHFNIPALQSATGGMSGGEFAFALARSEMGKSALAVSLAMAPGGWCDQGATVGYWVNEEPAPRTMLRGINAYTGLTRDEIRANPRRAKLLFEPIRSRIKMYDDCDLSIEQLDVWCKHNEVNILVIDQLDKLSVNGSFARDDERLQELYIQARRIAKRHNIAVFALTQASADAENKRRVTFAMAAGSKTGKAAEADLIIGISRPVTEEGNPDDPTRVLYLSKNKLSGFHGEIIATLDTKLSRYEG